MKTIAEEKPLKWFAVITKYRNEKSVVKKLNEQGIQAYVPLKAVMRQYISRKKTHFIPLISCYAFVKIELKDRIKVLNTSGVIDFIKFSNKIIEIPEKEIKILKQITEGKYPLEVIPEQPEFKNGELVEIITGQLMGVKGRLINIKNKKRLVVAFENIKHSIIIETDSRILRKVV